MSMLALGFASCLIKVAEGAVPGMAMHQHWCISAVCNDHVHLTVLSSVQEIVDFQGFYLEDDIHYAAHEPRFEQLKLESVEAETKFTDSQIMARLQGIFVIK